MRSIRGRLTLWITSSTVLLVVGAGALLYLFVHGSMVREFDASLRERAQTLASLLRVENNGELSMDYSDPAMPEYLPGKRAEYFEAVLMDGRVFERSLSLRNQDLVDVKHLSSQHRIWDLTLPDGRPGRAVQIVTVPHSDQEDRDVKGKHPDTASSPPPPPAHQPKPPKVIFLAGRDRSELDHAATVLLWALSVTAAALAVSTIVVVRVIVARELQPVDRVAAQAAQIGPSTLDLRFEVDSLPAELRPICVRLNDLLARLDQAFRRERRINADIAHELRTPIAELRSLTEVASLWPGDERQMSTYLRDAHDVALRMESIVEQLLALARSQTGRNAVRAEELDLSSLLPELVERHRAAATRKNVDIGCEASGGHVIRADRTMLSQIVENLISNAIEYSPETSRIECRLERGIAGYVLKISNGNTTLTADDLPKLFEPFWRKDASRAGGSHLGLGLTLVRELAQQLGYSLSANLPTSDRFEISVLIPGSTSSDSNMDHHLPVIFESAK